MLLNLSLGLLFATCARDRLRSDGPFAMPALILVLTFIGVVLVPVTLYLYLVHSAWSWAYLVDPGKVPQLAVIPVIVVLGGAVFGGWYAGSWLLRSDSRRALLYAGAGTGAASLILLALLWARLTVYGSYGRFQAGQTEGLLEVKLGYVLIVLVLAVAAAAGVVALELARDSRRVRAR